MAASSNDLDASKPLVLDRFQIFITQIAEEITTVETKILKSLIRGHLPPRELESIDTSKEARLPALDLVGKLQEYRLLSQNNLHFFRQALETTGRVDLAKKIDIFQETVTELRDVPLLQMEALPAPNNVFLRLLLRDPKISEELTQRVNTLREAICKKLGLNLKDVYFIRREGANFQDHIDLYVFIVFQFPNQEPKIMELNCDALNKAKWLVDLGVLQLQIGDKASINIKENLQEIRPIPKRQTSFLAMKSRFDFHQEDALDVILGIEFSYLVDEGVNRQILQQSQSALDRTSQLQHGDGYDMNLGVVTYGNHCNTPQPIAFASDGLSKDFDAMSNENHSFNGEGCCGMSDAVSKVLELAKDVRKEANKVCLMFTFLNQQSCDPEYYTCSHGNDIIKQCYALARSGITLYIIGINTEDSAANEENHFLSGVAAIGGGLYLEVDDVSSLNEIITCIVKHDVSIEKQAKDGCKALIDEINRKYGIVNINHLSRNLKQILNTRAPGTSLTVPISQIAQRVAAADDLEDAISAMKTMSERFVSNGGRERHQANMRSCARRMKLSCEGLTEVAMATGVGQGDHYKMKSGVLVDNSSEKSGNSACLAENEEIDLEFASRMVRRLLHRLEYQKIDEVQG